MKIIEDCNTALKQLEGTKIKDATEFHNLIAETINPILNKEGLKYGTWGIRLINDDLYCDLFSISKKPTIKQDLRYKNEYHGTLEVIAPILPEYTCQKNWDLGKYIEFVKIEKLTKRIAEREKEIARIKHELEEQKGFLASNLNELTLLQTKFNEG